MKSTIHAGRLWLRTLVVALGAVLAMGASAAQEGNSDLDAIMAETQATHPNGTARYIVTEALRGKLSSTAGDWEGRAFEVVKRYRNAFGLANPRAQLVLRITRADLAGGQHVRLSQIHRGIGVEGAELVVHFDRHGEPISLTGFVVPNLGLDTTPAIDAEFAGRMAILTVTAAAPGERLGVSDARLVIYNNGLVSGTSGANALAYKITVIGSGVREFVFVDALNGKILDQITGIYHTRNRSTYNMNNGISYAAATLARTEGQGPVGNSDVDNAHDYAGDTYDLYFNAYRRDSIDDLGFPLNSYVHYRVNYQNAFWDGQRMTYGDGFPVDDVAGHEITHGVTERTSNLIYRRQSGALNESLSDIFGEMIDQLNGRGDDSAGVKWLMGEDIPGIGAIRDMSNPPAFGDPDRVGSPLYNCGAGDNGGVHTNSGVPNKNFALLTDGGTFNGRTVIAMGLTKAGAIHYQAQTNYLVPLSQFRDYFIALWRSCLDLRGIVLNDPVTGQPSGEVISTANCFDVLRAGVAVQFLAPNCQ